MIQVWSVFLYAAAAGIVAAAEYPSERFSINENWRFTKGDPTDNRLPLLYDLQPEVRDRRDAEMRTAGQPAKLKLKPDRPAIRADGLDLLFFSVTVTDKSGQVVRRADNMIRFRIEGPGEIVATDNGDPTSMVPFQSLDRRACNGHCLAFVRARAGQSGRIRVTASSGELRSDTAFISCRQSAD